MLERTIKILTAHSSPHKTCVMGNEGIARAALEAGVNGVFSYPGTPSTEISEIFNFINGFQNSHSNKLKYPELTSDPVYFEYSINEKIALEKAIAFSIGNRSAMCVMKNVGMNVASDPLMSVTYQTIGAPLVIVVCDDPGCHSSSNEQDSRYWGRMASVPVFNPATPADAFEMIKQAFELSGKIKLPVIVRTTTRVSHTRGIVSYGNIVHGNRQPNFERLPEHINIPARTAAAHARLLHKLEDKQVLSLLAANTRLVLKGSKAKLGIISSGVATSYVIEILHRYGVTEKIKLLDIGMIHPFPEKEVLRFLKDDMEQYLVLEELDPLMENEVRTLAQKSNIQKNIFGKGYSGLVSTGEFSMDLLTAVLEKFLHASFNKDKNIPLENSEKYFQNLPPRPPVLCAGCPHRATFYLLKLAIPREQSELILCGDIGCFGLGALPPLKMIDTINHMGMSISMAQGLYEAFHSAGENKKTVALVGDGTFFHSGLSSLVNAVYTRANILVVIFDNRTIGMTGHQSHPGASSLPKYHEIDIPPLLKGLGIEMVETINPFDLKESIAKLDKAMAHDGVSVIISKEPCIFVHDFREKGVRKMQIAVDPERCNSCANHEDVALSCSRCYAPKNNLSRAKAKLLAEISIPGNEQLCPANICNHGFFNSILEGDYKSAVEIVRDKMLFARTCGDICHRPCELFSNESSVVPIKKLKHLVSAVDDNYRDFSVPVKRTQNARKKNKKIAVIGAGPAGLSAAYDLAQVGYEVEIFEKENKAGGMVAHAIPGFRMDKTAFDYEAMQLEKMGVKFHFNISLGKEIWLESLTEEYDAVILAVGMNKSKTLEVIEKNIPPEKRTDALLFLKSFNREEETIKPGSSILVIGGGNSAIDAARSAKKMSVKNQVLVSCIETLDKMPAFAEEVRHAMEEGIEFLHDSVVESCSLDTSGKIQCSLHAFDEKTFLQQVSCDYIVTAIGQVAEALVIEKLSSDENLRVISKNSHTGYKNVFVAGDINAGNHMSVIGAIASGKKAAVAARQLLEEYPYAYEGEKALGRLNTNSPLRNTNQKEFTNEEGELGDPYFVRSEIERYNLFQSCQKCNHCIDNFGCPAMVKVNGKVQIDMARCNLCGLCIDVCPNNAIHWVDAEEKTGMTS
ncbi:MAG: thiamine pyrophosphate-dependent enzyme [Bacteroidetes bacterium]|nr:thiamine pyrophosphate-dependent enzyme [Bacteroidota bacterium]